ncbi:MAG: hypothetical protein V4710_00100 [Verrucomicrobiota bacterium]
MKTITEYQPLIFGSIQRRTELREIRRAYLLSVVGKSLPAVYITAGLVLSMDTGYAPWNWQFWVVMAPLFVAVEVTFHAMSRRWESTAATGATTAEPAGEKREESRASRWIFNSLRPSFVRSFGHRRVLSYPLVRVN